MPFLWQQPHLLSGPLLSLSVSLSVAAVAPKVKCQCSQLCPSPPYPATPCPSPHLPTANNAKPPTKATPVTFFCLFFSPLFSSFLLIWPFVVFLSMQQGAGWGRCCKVSGPGQQLSTRLRVWGVGYTANPRPKRGREGK